MMVMIVIVCDDCISCSVRVPVVAITHHGVCTMHQFAEADTGLFCVCMSSYRYYYNAYSFYYEKTSKCVATI